MKKTLGPHITCKRSKCDGVLFNITPRLAHALGVAHLKCDRCGNSYAVKARS